MAVGTGGGEQGGGRNCPPPNILPAKKFKSVKITTYKHVYSNKAKYAHSSLDILNQRCTNVQNCIVLICKCDTQKIVQNFFAPPPPQSKSVPTAL